MMKFIFRGCFPIFGALTLLFVLAGCSSCSSYQVHPGSIPVAGDKGAFDSLTADFLADEKAFLDDAGTHAADYSPAVQQALAHAHQQYFATKSAYLNWRTLQTADAMNTLVASKTQLKQSVASFAAAKNGAP